MTRPRSILRAALAASFVAIAALCVAGPALADNPTIGHVFAVGDHVLPGETMTILGGQLEAGEELVVRLSTASGVAELGRVLVAGDGTIQLTAPLSTATPVGYATITATDRAGAEWTASVLIGERPEGPGVVQPSSDDAAFRWLALLLFAVGVVIFLAAGARYLRRSAVPRE